MFSSRLTLDKFEEIFRNILTNTSSSISHLHICGQKESGARQRIGHIIDSMVYAPQATGSVTYRFIHVNAAYVNGNLRTLLAHIAEEFSEWGVTSTCKMDNLNDLLDLISEWHARVPHLRLYFVFEMADSLSLFSPVVLSAVFRLAMTRQHFLRIITIGHLDWSDIANSHCVVSEPVCLFVRTPSREECVRLIQRAMPSLSPQLISLVVDNLYLNCNDANKLCEITKRVSDQFSRSGASAEVQTSRAAIKLIHDIARDDVVSLLTKKDAAKADMPLPICAKYLLLAAFCAGHNAAATDKRYFTKFHGREQRSEAKERHASLIKDQKDPEPRQFDLQRLTFIYHALVRCYPPAKGAEFLNNVNSQVASLVSMGLLCRTSSAGNLDLPKFRCQLSYETARSIAEGMSRHLSDGKSIVLENHLEPIQF